MGSSFIHLIRTDSNEFFLMAESYSTVYMCHSFLITVLFLIGAFLIIIGSLLLAGYVSKGGADGPVPLVIIGILVFLQILPPVHRLLCIQRLPGILLWWHSRVSWLAPTPALRKESQMELSPALNIEQKLWLRAKDFCSLQMFNQTVAKLYGSVLKDVN